MLFRRKRALSHLPAVAALSPPWSFLRLRHTRFTNFGVKSRNKPSMSWVTSTWPSQSGPAPMPMVGISIFARHASAQRRRYALEHERERAALLHGHRVAQHLIRPFIGLALHLEAAELHERFEA